jgi:hypothetical protein
MTKGRRINFAESTRLYASASSGMSHREFLETVAKADVIPKRLDALLKILAMDHEDDVIVSPTDRQGLNPFLVPIARSKKSTDPAHGVLCYIRWPTQKEGMELQLVRTTEAGITLEALSTSEYILRKAVELDFAANPAAQSVLDVVNEGERIPLYTIGDYLAFLKSGKFPTLTEHDRRIVLDKFLLTKVGQFPDSYERIANNFMDSKNEVSALVTCERALMIFYGWGSPCAFHSSMLLRCEGRDKEAKDSAKAAMGMPAWTIASNFKDLERCIITAGFSGLGILGEMHQFRSTDERKDEIGEGLSPIQVTLDQAAHLMDAVGFGKGDWETTRPLLAQKYRDGGYPDMAAFIETNSHSNESVLQ